MHSFWSQVHFLTLSPLKTKRKTSGKKDGKQPGNYINPQPNSQKVLTAKNRSKAKISKCIQFHNQIESKRDQQSQKTDFKLRFSPFDDRTLRRQKYSPNQSIIGTFQSIVINLPSSDLKNVQNFYNCTLNKLCNNFAEVLPKSVCTLDGKTLRETYLKNPPILKYYYQQGINLPDLFGKPSPKQPSYSSSNSGKNNIKTIYSKAMAQTTSPTTSSTHSHSYPPTSDTSS